MLTRPKLPASLVKTGKRRKCKLRSDRVWMALGELSKRWPVDPARWQIVPASLTSVRTKCCAWSDWEALAAEHRRNDACGPRGPAAAAEVDARRSKGCKGHRTTSLLITCLNQSVYRYYQLLITRVAVFAPVLTSCHMPHGEVRRRQAEHVSAKPGASHFCTENALPKRIRVSEQC